MRGSRFVLALLLVAVVACGEDAAETTPADAPTATPTTTTTQAPATTPAPTTTTTEPEQASGIESLDFVYHDPASFPTIDLVDPGAEPREVRSWMPAVGSVVSMTTTITSTSEQSTGGAEPMSSDFTATIDATVEIVGMTDEGFVARTVFDAAEVSASDPLNQSALQGVYDDLIGVVVHQLTRPDGAIIAQEGTEALGQGDVLGNGLGGIAVPLPTEPIGVGAVWTADQLIGVEGIQISQTVAMRVLEIQGDQLTIEIEATAAFDPDSNPEELASITLEGTSTGTAVWDLSIGMPVSAISESVQIVEGGDSASPFSVRTVTSIEVSAQPAE